MVLVVDNTEDIVKIILDRMTKFGITYHISKNFTGPKTGVLPQTDIETVEKTILELETQVLDNPDRGLVECLMDLYGKVSNINKLILLGY